MQYAIELYFDKNTEDSLLRLANRIGEEKLSTGFLSWKSRPHLTLGCFNDVDEAEATALLECFAYEHQPMTADIESVGMFTDTRVIFAQPVMTAEMYQLQRELYDCFAAYDTTGWEWYRPDAWTPHCTLALLASDGEEAFLQASQLVLREFQKTVGQFTAVGLVKVTHPVEELFTFPLGQ